MAVKWKMLPTVQAITSLIMPFITIIIQGTLVLQWKELAIFLMDSILLTVILIHVAILMKLLIIHTTWAMAIQGQKILTEIPIK